MCVLYYQPCISLISHVSNGMATGMYNKHGETEKMHYLPVLKCAHTIAQVNYKHLRDVHDFR